MQVCEDSLHSVRMHDRGKLIATGSHSGSITLLELSDSLSVLQPNEKQNVNMVSGWTSLELFMSSIL